jgi:hypothetical protein
LPLHAVIATAIVNVKKQVLNKFFIVELFVILNQTQI